jgi:hypothetical protein
MIMSKHLMFEDDGEKVFGKPEYLVRNKRTKGVLARVCWYPPWKQWVSEPAPNTIWSHDCMADMREFVLSLNAEAGRIAGNKEDS